MKKKAQILFHSHNRVIIPPWTPVDLAGKQIWIKSDVGISSPLAIDIWQDQSGNGNDLIQSSVGARPSLISNQLNGYPAVRFDGIDDFLKNPSNVTALVQPVTVFLIFKLRTLVVGRTILDGTATFSQNIQPTGATTLQMYAGAGGIYNPDLVPGTYQLMTCIFDNGTSVIQMGNFPEITGNVGTSNGQGICLGGRPDAADFSELDLVEGIVTNTIVSGADRDNMKEYTVNRYGIVI